jgi:hypothetical protein
MRRQTVDGLLACVDCGTSVDVERVRGYRGLGDWVLCWACALNRGAFFDEQEDRWTVPPSRQGLPPEDDHRVR